MIILINVQVPVRAYNVNYAIISKNFPKLKIFYAYISYKIEKPYEIYATLNIHACYNNCYNIIGLS